MIFSRGIDLIWSNGMYMEYAGQWIAWEDVTRFRHDLQAAGRRVVVTNGCFDLLHTGHLRYLTAARRLGDFLWIGLNDDASVRVLKGPTRPIHTAEDRAEILLGLRVVDAVTIFTDPRATNFLREVQPDIYVKGGDYQVESLDAEERAVLEASKARIEILPLVPGKSTTNTLQKAALNR